MFAVVRILWRAVSLAVDEVLESAFEIVFQLVLSWAVGCSSPTNGSLQARSSMCLGPSPVWTSDVASDDEVEASPALRARSLDSCTAAFFRVVPRKKAASRASLGWDTGSHTPQW